MGDQTLWQASPVGPVRRLTLALLAGPLALCLPTPGLAQGQPDSTETEARAAIVTFGSLVMARDLDFGDILASPSAGTVTISPTGTRTATGGVTLTGANHHAAIFAGRGRRNQQIELSIGTPVIWLTGPGAPMRVDLFELSDLVGGLRGNRPGRYRITTTNGMFTFTVGATLHVNAGQNAGRYSGNFSVLYEYQ